MNSYPSLLRRLLGLLLGLFVLWQLLFLLGWNLLLLAEAAKPRLEEADFVQRLAPDWPRGECEAQEGSLDPHRRFAIIHPAAPFARPDEGGIVP